jgi:hypothetical protein
MNQAKMPRTVADAARMTKIQRLSCTSGHWYRRRVSRYTTSVAIVEGKKESDSRAKSRLVQQTASLRKLENWRFTRAKSCVKREKYIRDEVERGLGG